MADIDSTSNSKHTALVNPVEMLLRIRQHAAGRASNKSRIYTDQELHAFISMYVDGEIPDYQMSAWLMAVCFCPLTSGETATLTRCYAESGRIVNWPIRKSRPPLVDKHSSGGVGDKVSLVLAPLAAACGICVPMMAGRGLGHTGGTIDKLETSFPGYRATLESVQEFSKIVLGSSDETERIGCSIVKAGPDLCPADGRIYALRDVTSTVSCLPLITASIMSKKIAENPDSLVLDVKYGNGAFRETIEDARTLAESMVAVGEANGLNPTIAFLTGMDHPLGRAVGNWVEVAECIDIMKGNLRNQRKSLMLSNDLISLVVIEVGQMLHQSGSGRETNEEGQPYEEYKHMSLEECIHHAYQVLDSGKALDKFRKMLLAQGAEPLHLERALEIPEAIPLATFVAVWKFREDSNHGNNDTYIANVPAKLIGDVAVDLGTGRRKAGEKVDGQAGLVFEKQTGDYVVDGDVIVTLYTNRSQQIVDEALERVRASVVFEKGTSNKASKRIVTHIVTKEGGTKGFVTPSFLLEK